MTTAGAGVATSATAAATSSPAPAANSPAGPPPAQVAGAAQTITGFGASGAWWPNDLAAFSSAAQKQVANLLFTNSGIRLSQYRYNIGGGGVGVTTPARAPQTFLNADGSYDWTKDPGGQAFLKLAAADDVPDLIGFVNSAPPQFTTNGQSCAGSINTAKDTQYGGYLAAVVKHFASQGIGLSQISPMNEPDDSFGSCGQEGMAVAPADRAGVINAVGSALKQAGRSGTKVIADESSLTTQLTSEAPGWLADPTAPRSVGAIAHHTYDFPTGSQLEQVGALGATAGKPLWATEICCQAGGGGYGSQYDPTVTGALTMVNSLYDDLAYGNDSAFQWWTALSSEIGCDPTQASCATSVNSDGWNDGLIYYDPNYATDGNQTLYVSKRFYALGQYSKYVRPGAVRYAVTGAPTGVQPLAFRQNGSWVVVVANTNAASTSFGLNLHSTGLAPAGAYRTSATEDMAGVAAPSVSGSTISASLPARSISTYVLSSSGSPGSSGYADQELVGGQSSRCLTAAVATGAPSVSSTCTGAAGQKFQLRASGAIVGSGGSRCLDTQSGTAPGTAVVVRACSGASSQRWVQHPDGSVTNVASGLCLEVAGQSTADGAQVDEWTCNGGANQQWTPTSATAQASGRFDPGQAWTDTAGNVLQMHGLGIVKVGSTWYGFGEDKTGENANDAAFQDIPCYSSTDLSNWTYRGRALTRQASGDLGPGRVVERPKVIYNASTKQYVMYMHIDSSSYGEAKVGVATSASPCGPYSYRGSFQPLGFQSRDLGLFQDTDGTAYLLSEDRANGLRIDRLSADYLSVVGSVAVLPDYEAPAMTKVGGTYYLFGSHLSGWSTNDNVYATATSLAGPWSAFQSFAPGGTDTYDSQTANIIPVQGASGTTYIYAGDRWQTSDLGGSPMIWLPLTITGTSVSMSWYSPWTLNASAGTWSQGAASVVGAQSQRCLDVANQSVSAGAGVDVWDCNGGANQKWSLSADGSIEGTQSGLCLDVANQSTSPGATVDMWPCNGGANQKWTVQSDGSIVGRQSGLCLDVAGQATGNGTGVDLWTCDGAGNQRWSLTT
ncbi:ricin-type beta-trefoil lectin domain protein [Streptacidiphilus anmyonensis]|uniref:ricin-type beta-trefoil lectin domain protein n=1 Tax=Streptacidiphilus anmyonensis TaxID=405782 RepID=UPI0007C71004|nr:ricin-type beta-trefoil lectin domain protein [Streptacidiphilus anmyonensis]